MAAATRALGHVAHLHALELDELHLPYAGEAVTRSGHPLPATTRERYRNVDILVASSDEPAFAGVKADLELSWRIARAHLGERKNVVAIAPLGPWADATAIETHSPAPPLAGRASPRAPRARTGTRSSSAAGAAIQGSPGGAGRPRRSRDPPEGAAREIDVVVTETHLLDALVEAASHFAARRRRWRTAGCPSAARRLRPRRERIRPSRRLRRRRPDRNAPDRFAASGRGAQAARFRTTSSCLGAVAGPPLGARETEASPTR